jgi:non-heme chloroperoxidase
MNLHHQSFTRRLASGLIGVLVGAAAVTAQQASATGGQSSAADASPHRSAFVTVKDVRIHYLDWSGTGLALVFIPGMGNSAHVFDDFAPRFIDRFRVVGVTRVGFGESDQPERDGYDIESRVAHIRATLDALQITRAVLIGHSLGGDEITAFAGTHPERTAALVYLDAALDHSGIAETQKKTAEFMKARPGPGAADLASARAYQQFVLRQQGVELPIGEIIATRTFDAEGRLRGPRASQRVIAATVAATVPPDFAKIKSPVLALYSDQGRTAAEAAAEMLAFLRDDPAMLARATPVVEQIRTERKAKRDQFAREVKGAQIFTYRAHHYQFLSDPEDTERRIRAFLSSLKNTVTFGAATEAVGREAIVASTMTASRSPRRCQPTTVSPSRSDSRKC